MVWRREDTRTCGSLLRTRGDGVRSRLSDRECTCAASGGRLGSCRSVTVLSGRVESPPATPLSAPGEVGT